MQRGVLGGEHSSMTRERRAGGEVGVRMGAGCRLNEMVEWLSCQRCLREDSAEMRELAGGLWEESLVDSSFIFPLRQSRKI